VLTTLIAVAGTLLGVLATGLLQARAQHASRAAASQDARTQAIAALSCALAEHRGVMFKRECARLSGADAATLTGARAVSHTTRAAVTEPLTTVCILIPALAGAARTAAKACYALRDAADHDTLAALRETALAAADRLIDDAAHHLG